MNQTNQLDRLPPSPQWLIALDQAIFAGDEERLWEVMSQHRDSADAHDRLATQIARLAYRVSDRVRFSEMFLVPVIEAPGTGLLDDQDVWRQGDFCIGEAIDSWLAPRTRKTVFHGVRPYDWVATWRPGVLRRQLTSTIPGSAHKKVQFLSERIEMPSAAPRLGFISMVLTAERGWPQLPDADTLRDNRFKKVVAYALQMREGQEPHTVLPPDRVQFAVADGLSAWLFMVHEAVGIRGWVAAPLKASPDVVKITLAFNDEAVPYTQFTVRKHQIGLTGLEEVLSVLAQLADPLDFPIDLPPREQKALALDLT